MKKSRQHWQYIQFSLLHSNTKLQKTTLPLQPINQHEGQMAVIRERKYLALAVAPFKSWMYSRSNFRASSIVISSARSLSLFLAIFLAIRYLCNLAAWSPPLSCRHKKFTHSIFQSFKFNFNEPSSQIRESQVNPLF